MALLENFQVDSPEGVGNIAAQLPMSVTTVLALTTTAVGTTNVKPTAVCRGIYLSTGGTLTYKLQKQDDARARILGAGYHPLKITEITNMGACVGEFYW